MLLARKRRMVTAVAASTVVALALLGGSYAAFLTTDTAPGQDISSASSSLRFDPTALKQNFGATYNKLAAGDTVISFIDLVNAGTNSLENFTISQVSTSTTGGLDTLGSSGGEGLSVKIERVGPDSVVLNTIKLATVNPNKPMILAALARDEIAHLKFTITLDQAAVIQNQSLSTIYTVNASQVVAGAVPPTGPQSIVLTGTPSGGMSWSLVSSPAARMSQSRVVQNASKSQATSSQPEYKLTRTATTLAVEAQLSNSIAGTIVDAAGNVFVADTGNNRIAKIATDGTVSTFAGGGTSGVLSEPQGLAVDSNGVMYVAEPYNNRIAKIATDGTVSTFVVSGSESAFNQPLDVAVDAGDNVYVADYNNERIAKITPLGVVSTLAGSTGSFTTGVEVDGAGNVYEAAGGYVRKFTPGGAVTSMAVSAELDYPHGMTVSNGVVYVADTNNHRIAQIDANGTVSTFALSGSASELSYPTDVAVDAAGVMYVTDSGNKRVAKIAAGGAITTLAGGLLVLDKPRSAAANADGEIYVADTGHDRIVKIATNGTLTTVGAPGEFSGPRGVAVGPGGVVYVTDTNHARIAKIATDGAVTTLAGGVDGNGNDVFWGLRGVAVDADGVVYAADAYHYRIAKITPAGVVTTLVGGVDAVGEPVVDAHGNPTFGQPAGVAVGADGVVYTIGNRSIGETSVQTVYKIPASGVMEIVSANGDFTSSLQGIAVDAAGVLYVSEYNNRVAKIAPDGTVTTLLDHSVIESPRNISVDALGNVYVADYGKHAFFKINPNRIVTGGLLTGLNTVAGNTAASFPYSGPALGYTDSSLPAGPLYTYQVTDTGTGAVSNTIGPFTQ